MLQFLNVTCLTDILAQDVYALLAFVKGAQWAEHHLCSFPLIVEEIIEHRDAAMLHAPPLILECQQAV